LLTQPVNKIHIVKTDNDKVERFIIADFKFDLIIRLFMTFHF
jgi:hypothetical protein